MDRINRIFFVPENVDLEAARLVVRKPRLGDVYHAFKARNLDRLRYLIRIEFKEVLRRENQGLKVYPVDRS